MKSKVYIIRGYKPSAEPYGPCDSDILGYTTSKAKCDRLIEKFKDQYIPKYLDHATVEMIGWRFKDNFNDYLSSEWVNKKANHEELRKDWEKFGGGWRELIYTCINYEEVELLNEDKLPKCQYRRSIIETK